MAATAPITLPDRRTACCPFAVPEQLRGMPRWLNWGYAARGDDSQKVPISPLTLKVINAHDQEHHVDFCHALAVAMEHPSLGVAIDIVGGDGLVGIDIDDCIDADGAICEEAMEIIRAVNSYTEISPSGTGVKIYAWGVKPDWAGCSTSKVTGFGKLEIYSGGRMFCVTGRHLEGTPPDVRDAQAAVDALCARYWSPPVQRPRLLVPHPSSEQQLLRRAGAYLAMVPAAVSGSGGHSQTFAAATAMVHGFGLEPDVAFHLLMAEYNPRCQPPWSEKEIRHKVEQAASTPHRQPYGWLRDAARLEPALAPHSQSPAQPTAGAPGEGAPMATQPDDDAGPTPRHAQAPPADGVVPLGSTDPRTGRLVLAPKRTLPTAEAYIHQFHTHRDGRTLHAYGGVLMEWLGNRYCQVEDGAIKQCLQPWLHRALRYVPTKDGVELADFDSNPTTVNQALDTIRSYVHLPAATTSPSWLDGDSARPPALEVLPCRTLNLHIPSGQILPATPALFTINALDFDYARDADPPERWIRFLEQLWGDDLESVDLLQEWMGYCLISDTRQQKMLMLVGPKRSGKGTIGRVLKSLVGAANVAGPTTSSLASHFGLQDLIGKSLAIVSDARFGGEHVGVAVERLLCISGEDALSIPRKYLTDVNMKLPTRFMFLTNELPRFSDASGALASRFLLLRLTHSFYGQEDMGLSEALTAELPGILTWAIDGWKRLQARGHFVQPASAEEEVQELADLSSPAGAFARECCVFGAGHRISIDSLYLAFKLWCEREGRNVVPVKSAFGRDLQAAFSELKARKGTDGRFYDGIGLKAQYL